MNEMTIFEQWWQAIQPALEANTLNFWQNLYKEIYMNLIKDDRWLQYLKGLGITLQVSFYAILVGVALGTLLAILRLPQVQNVSARGKGFWANLGVAIVKLLSKFAGCYINLFRGTPLLLQVLIINFGIFGSVRIDKVIIGVIACGLNSAAYVAEIIRGGLMSLDPGQAEAGRSLGLNYIDTMRFIVIPQAFKAILPSLGNEFITLLKDTALIYTIGGEELVYAAKAISTRTYEQMFPLVGTAVIYLVLVLIFTWLQSILERRLRQSDRH